MTHPRPGRSEIQCHANSLISLRVCGANPVCERCAEADKRPSAPRHSCAVPACKTYLLTDAGNYVKPGTLLVCSCLHKVAVHQKWRNVEPKLLENLCVVSFSETGCSVSQHALGEGAPRVLRTQLLARPC